ncbi:hypothetical protein Tco_0740578 [Tanacetum coccineum]
MLWEWRGIANMDFIQLGGSSRVGEMILARERSGFAGEKCLVPSRISQAIRAGVLFETLPVASVVVNHNNLLPEMARIGVLVLEPSLDAFSK